MQYTIGLKTKTYHQNGEWYYLTEALLPGIIPNHVFDMMECPFVENELDLCRLCDVQSTRCHIELERRVGRSKRILRQKLCPILFHDVVKPKWKLDDIV
jgi:hypothetical protein